MSNRTRAFSLVVETTQGRCPIGEAVGQRAMDDNRIPVFSCEGACIRGEIARLAAHYVAKERPYRRACHGELLTVPQSAIAQWARSAERAIVIDGCSLRCHARAMRELFEPGRLVEIDALSHYKRYCDIFDIDDVPEEERKATARAVADWVLADPAAAASGRPQ